MLIAGLVCFWGMGFFFYAFRAFSMLMVFFCCACSSFFFAPGFFFMLMVSFFMLRVLFFMRHCGKRSRWGVLVQNVIVRRV